MMKRPEEHIFLSSGCLREEVLYEYARGGFSGEVREHITAHIKACQLCRDALEGIRIHDDTVLLQEHVSRLRERVKGNVRMRKSLRRRRVQRIYPFMAAAASIMILAGILSVISLYRNRPDQNLADQEKLLPDSASPAPEMLRKNVTETSKTEPPEKKEPEQLKTVKQAPPVPGEKPVPEPSATIRRAETVREVEAVPGETEVLSDAFKGGDVRQPEEITGIAFRGEATGMQETLSYQIGAISKTIPVTAKSVKRVKVESVRNIPEKNVATFVSEKYRDFADYITKNLHVPDSIIKGEESYTVIISFTVDTSGNIINTEVMESADTVLNKEAIRVINASPRWVPATLAGRPVPEKHLFPVTFKPAGDHDPQDR